MRLAEVELGTEGEGDGGWSEWSVKPLGLPRFELESVRDLFESVRARTLALARESVLVRSEPELCFIEYLE